MSLSDPWAAELREQQLQWAARSRTATGFGWMRDDGTVDSSRPDELWIVTRMTHVLCLATALGDDRWGPLLEHGQQSMRTVFRDTEHGGWYATAGSDGSGWSKRLYEHAFVLLASASLTAVGAPGARSLLDEALDALDRHFWEDDAGAALEARRADWSDPEPYRGANGNMHLVEALLAAGDVTGDGTWPRRALRVAQRLVDGEARHHEWRLPEHFDPSWNVVPEFNRDRPDDPFRPYGITPGHGVEWARLLLHLETALGDDAPSWLPEAAVQLAERALSDGWRDPGGIVYTTDWSGAPVVAERFHWVACEGVLTAHALAERTADPLWRSWFDRLLSYAVEHHVAPDGSWVHELDPVSLAQSRRTWDGRPDVYHAYQMLLLPTLPPRASAIGTALASS